MGEQIYSYDYQIEIGLLRIKLSILTFFGFFKMSYVVALHKKSSVQTNVCISEMLFPSLL